METLTLRRAIPICAVLATATLGLLGAPPILVTITATATWWRPLVSRFGHAGASAVAAVAWVWSTFFAATIAIALPGGVSSTAIITHAGLGVWGAIQRSRMQTSSRGSAATSPSVPRSMLAWASVGSGLWMVTWALSARGVGSGLGWSIYSDSARDMWFIRQNLIAGGLPFVGELSLWPVEHTITTAQLSVRESFGTSSAQVEAQLNAHALGWSLLIALSCFLAGMLAGSTALRLTSNRRVALLASACASLVVLWMPITGFSLRVGQLNVHMVLVLVLASLLVEFDARLPLWMKAVLHCSVMVLMLLVWIPFAVLPGVFAAVGVVGATRRGDLRKPAPLAALGTTGVACAFYVSNFVLPALEPVTSSAAHESIGPLAIQTSHPNPTSLPGAMVIAVALIAMGQFFRRRDRRLGAQLMVTVLTLASVIAAYGMLRGGLRVESEYYAAKLLSISTIVAGLTLIGPLFSLVSFGRQTRAAMAVTGCGLLAVVCLTPARSHAEPWAFAPWQTLVASTYGPASSTSQRVVDYSSDTSLALAWRLEPPYDVAVNLMQTSLERTTTDMWGTPLRSRAREELTHTSVQQLCAIAESADLPVEAHTSDPRLADEVLEACPRADIVVRLERQ